MKALSILMSLIFIGFYSPNLNAQICHVDDSYYYHNNRKHRKHYKKNYRQDRKSIMDFKRRIEQGVWSGELTRKEERFLKRRVNRLVKLESKAYRNGYISRSERRKIKKIQHKLDDLIYDRKHNSRTRY